VRNTRWSRRGENTS